LASVLIFNQDRAQDVKSGVIGIVFKRL